MSAIRWAIEGEADLSGRTLSPIVDDVGARTGITWIVVPMHCYALNFCSETTRNKQPVSLLARHIGAGQQVRHATRYRKSLAGVEQANIVLFG